MNADNQVNLASYTAPTLDETADMSGRNMFVAAVQSADRAG